MIWLLIVAGCVAIAYQLAACLAAVRHRMRAAAPDPPALPGISVLKPVYGLDAGFAEAVRSHLEQDYPDFEVLFGSNRPEDAALAPVEIIATARKTPNPKVGVLCELERRARHAVFVVNDGDIRVPAGYLRSLAAELAEPGAGVVTCLYRASADSLAGRWEALGIATDFAPSVLVAPLVGVREFGLGATLAFRAGDLARAGGFEAVADYLADDYQIARRIAGLGLRVVLSRVVVETRLGRPRWADVWRHQVRWARTIRVSRGGGYLGLPVTHAGIWCAVLLLAGLTPWAAALVIARCASALATGWLVLRSPIARAFFWLAPLWDLWAFVVWIWGLTGSSIMWRGLRFRLSADGTISRSE